MINLSGQSNQKLGYQGPSHEVLKMMEDQRLTLLLPTPIQISELARRWWATLFNRKPNFGKMAFTVGQKIPGLPWSP
jgi:hypothetical protein